MTDEEHAEDAARMVREAAVDKRLWALILQMEDGTFACFSGSNIEGGGDVAAAVLQMGMHMVDQAKVKR